MALCRFAYPTYLPAKVSVSQSLKSWMTCGSDRDVLMRFEKHLPRGGRTKAQALTEQKLY